MLGYPFGRPHDACRPDCLVSGDEYEFLNPAFYGRLCHYVRTKDIDLHGLGRVILHHGHVLVGGRMEDYVCPVGPESPGKAFPVPDVTDYERDPIVQAASSPATEEMRIRPFQMDLHVMERC